MCIVDASFSVRRSAWPGWRSLIGNVLARLFLLPGDLACDALGLGQADNRDLVRMLVNSLVWTLAGGRHHRRDRGVTEHAMSMDQITEEAIRRLVDAFYTKVRADRELGPIFEHGISGDWGAHLPRCAISGHP